MRARQSLMGELRELQSGAGTMKTRSYCPFCGSSRDDGWQNCNAQPGDPCARMNEPVRVDRGSSWYFWKFVHNALIHPLLALPWEPAWAQRAHDWTALRCPGGESPAAPRPLILTR
ncbi:MAG TPA: hypothetical protein VMR17_01110 [Xanthobacteraceae bacterium]|nr:hypothetical protein [Xanthobacteraceae bacterium]